MGSSAVLFDLFGTLIPPFRMREHTETIRDCAHYLGVDFECCHAQWRETFPRRIRGEFGSIAAEFRHIARLLGQRVKDEALLKAEQRYRRFTLEGLTPVDGAIETLDELASRGVVVGLVTNCAPDVPLLWSESVLSRYFKYCAFSCRTGVAKPEPGIYRDALSALNLRGSETLYVGDGSDRELSGAARCGLKPILLRVDLSNTYDPQREDTRAWEGLAIQQLPEVVDLLS